VVNLKAKDNGKVWRKVSGLRLATLYRDHSSYSGWAFHLSVTMYQELHHLSPLRSRIRKPSYGRDML